MADINMSWVERLRAPRYLWSQIAAHNPQRGILCREQESQQQLLAWDVETGETREITPPVPYTLNATLSPDGEFITYLRTHPTHQEVFQYVRVPYLGSDPQPIAPTALMYASPHIEEAANARIGFTTVTPNGYSVQVWTPTSAKPLFSFDSEILAYGPALSADGTMAVIATLQSDTSEATHLEAYNIDTGEKISQLELLDTPLEVVKFAPVMGDSRLLVQAREGGLTRPLIWDVRRGDVEHVNGLKTFDSYTAWDWFDNNQLLLSTREAGLFQLLIYDFKKQRVSKGFPIWGSLLIAYVAYSKIIFHDETVSGVTVESYERLDALRIKKRPLFLPQQKMPYAFSGNVVSTHFWNDVNQQSQTKEFLENTPRVVGVTFKDEVVSYVEIAAWIESRTIYINSSLWGQRVNLDSPDYIVQEIQHDNRKALKYEPLTPSLLTGSSMGAVFALITLHQGSASMWCGGVVVRPILDWVHLYESVSPPEKAMMRLWFGGSPTDKPDEWRAASPLRQTTPLTVPVKLLYHPYDSLTPIQHIQTYAANNPTVELIDISRDLVGPAHEQQERLITRMLQAGLPLLTPPSPSPFT